MKLTSRINTNTQLYLWAACEANSYDSKPGINRLLVGARDDREGVASVVEAGAEAGAGGEPRPAPRARRGPRGVSRVQKVAAEGTGPTARPRCALNCHCSVGVFCVSYVVCGASPITHNHFPFLAANNKSYN